MKLVQEPLVHTRLTALLVAVLLASVSLANSLSAPASFEVSTTVIKATVKPGESISIPIVVLNGKTPQRLSVEPPSLGFISIDKNSFELSADQDASLNVSLLSQTAGVYVSNISIRGENKEVTLPVILEVESRILQFDASTSISQASSQVKPGGLFTVDVTLYNLRSLDSGVLVHFIAYKTDGSILFSETQPLNVAGSSVQISKTFTIPADASAGDYVFAVLADHNNSIGISSAVFAVTNKNMPFDFSSRFLESPIVLVGLAIIILLAVTLFALNHYWNQKIIANAHYWSQHKAKQIPEPKPTNIVEEHKQVHKLEYQRRLLKEAYARGYIKRTSYVSGMRRIDEVISKKKKPL